MFSYTHIVYSCKRICFVLLLISFRYLSATKCDFDVKVEQVLQNEGFHRNMTYGIVLNSDEDECLLFHDCILGIDQTLPSGLYANPDELSALRRINKINAIPKQRVNIEMPSEHSYATTTYILEKVRDCEVTMWLPVHARYHLAKPGGGLARNEIPPPKLYLRCPDQRLDVCSKNVTPVNFLCNSSKDKCIWREITYTLMTDTLKWHVPVGNLDSYYTITIGTAIVVMVGSFYLLKAIHEHVIV